MLALPLHPRIHAGEHQHSFMQLPANTSVTFDDRQTMASGRGVAPTSRLGPRGYTW